MNELSKVIKDLNIKNFTVVGNKVIIKDDVVIKNPTILSTLIKFPYKFVFNEYLCTMQVLPNFIIKGDLRLSHVKGIDVTYKIDTSRILYAGSSEFNTNIKAPIKASVIDLLNFNINDKVEADEEITLAKCTLNVNTVFCKNSITLSSVEFTKDFYIKDCKSVSISSLESLSDNLELKNIENLFLGFEERVGNKGSITLDRVDMLSTNIYDDLFYLKEPVKVDTFILPADILNSPYRYFGNVIPIRPMVICNKILILGKDYITSYPNILNIEKYIKLSKVII